MRIRSPLSRGPASLGALLAIALVPALAQAQKPGRPTPASPVATPQLTRLAESIPDFRRAVMEDYEAALAKYATDAARTRFQALDRGIWYGVPPRVGWAYFVNVSVLAFAMPDGDVNLVGFFNPWCDAALVTAWQEREPGRPRLVDAEVIAGEWLRDGAPLLEPRPAWLVNTGFRPLSAVQLAAETITAFEKRFSSGRKADWRRSLPALSDPTTLARVNYPAVAGRLIGTLSSVRDFVTEQKGEDARLGAVREALSRAQAQGVAGNAAEAFRSAKESLPAMGDALRAVPPVTWKHLVVVASVQARDGCLVLMVPREAPGLVFSFFFRSASASSVRLARIDVMLLQALLARGAPASAKRSGVAP